MASRSVGAAHGGAAGTKAESERSMSSASEGRGSASTSTAGRRPPTSSTSSPPRILVADDQPDVLQALRLLLKNQGFMADAVTSPAAILSALEQKDYDVLLMDLNYTRDTTSGNEGLDLLNHLRTQDPHLSVVVMTAWGSVQGAVEAVKRGAKDYIEKPWDNDRLVATLMTQTELCRALRRTERLEGENRMLRREGQPDLVCESRAMAQVNELVDRVAPSNANVLITGEHGTGKEVVARRIHAQSGRADAPLVTVNVGGIAEDMFDSELFGLARSGEAAVDRVGCFEMADGGTLFLDEVSTMPLAQQAKLLRVLQSGELQRTGSPKTRRVDVRVFCATNTDIHKEVSEGRFREDLLYRLNTVEITVPSLRERRDDVPVLARSFLRDQAERYNSPVKDFSPDALNALLEHPWPGNVRELEHAVERAVLMAEADEVGVADLGLRQPNSGLPVLETMTLNAAEKVLIQKALRRCDGNVTQAAGVLGVSRSALYRRLQRHGI